MIKGLVFLETVVDNWWEIKHFHFMLTLFILQRDSKFGSFSVSVLSLDNESIRSDGRPRNAPKIGLVECFLPWSLHLSYPNQLI